MPSAARAEGTWVGALEPRLETVQRPHGVGEQSRPGVGVAGGTPSGPVGRRSARTPCHSPGVQLAKRNAGWPEAVALIGRPSCA